MEIINITEEQKNAICNELARLTCELKKDTRIKCIYFAPYKVLGNVAGNVLEITVVLDSCENNDLDDKIEEYNLVHRKHDSIRKFGFKIFLDTEDIQKYIGMNPNSLGCKKINNLIVSRILYDSNGNFTQLKEQATSYVENSQDSPETYYYYDNLAEVYPPLDRVDITSIEDYSKIVKEYTKPKLG